jgi:hypothetical protein
MAGLPGQQAQLKRDQRFPGLPRSAGASGRSPRWLLDQRFLRLVAGGDQRPRSCVRARRLCHMQAAMARRCCATRVNTPAGVRPPCCPGPGCPLRMPAMASIHYRMPHRALVSSHTCHSATVSDMGRGDRAGHRSAALLPGNARHRAGSASLAYWRAAQIDPDEPAAPNADRRGWPEAVAGYGL